MNLETVLELHSLKEVKRAGWIRIGMDAPEDVASHSWGVAWLGMLLCPDDLNAHRVLQLGLIHDLVEVRTGDITPHDGISREQKRALEGRAGDDLLQSRPDLQMIWREYEAHETPESCFVHELDKLDMALQALRYAKTQELDTTEFIVSATQCIRHPVLTKMLEQISRAMKD